MNINQNCQILFVMRRQNKVIRNVSAKEICDLAFSQKKKYKRHYKLSHPHDMHTYFLLMTYRCICSKSGILGWIF